MKIQHTTTYCNDEDVALYHIAFKTNVAHINGKVLGDAWRAIEAFLDSEPIDAPNLELPSKRFVIVAANLPHVFNTIVLGFEVRPANIGDPTVVDHYNYYPARRGLTHTHTQTYGPSIAAITDPEFMSNVRHTYKSLAGLIGVQEEYINTFL